jgi:glutamyl-queuosine tRNA(Asp) synthetase
VTPHKPSADASSYVGRYAPSPTGDLHLGNALAAVVAWARARRAGGACRLRMEDLDLPRVVPGAAARIEADLATLGLAFDGPTLVQSQHVARYRAALADLRARGLLYACKCSRKELASAPHVGEEGPAYPGTCRALALPFDDPQLPVAWRFRVEPGEVVVEDALQGRFTQDVQREVGDFVVMRKDGVIPYQLAVVVDDLHQGVTEVVRGRDLLSSAPRQVLLFRALARDGQRTPTFAHTPLWVDERGERLSKRRGDEPTLLRALFDRGESGPQVLGRIARALGIAASERDGIDAPALADALDDAKLARATVR